MAPPLDQPLKLPALLFFALSFPIHSFPSSMANPMDPFQSHKFGAKLCCKLALDK